MRASRDPSGTAWQGRRLSRSPCSARGARACRAERSRRAACRARAHESWRSCPHLLDDLARIDLWRGIAELNPDIEVLEGAAAEVDNLLGDDESWRAGAGASGVLRPAQFAEVEDLADERIAKHLLVDVVWPIPAIDQVLKDGLVIDADIESRRCVELRLAGPAGPSTWNDRDGRVLETARVSFGCFHVCPFVVVVGVRVSYIP